MINYNYVSCKRGLKAGGGILNSLINKLPVELHLPGYNYCGPGTKLKERLERGDRGVNPLDEACREHDIAYSQSKDINHRHIADKKLTEKAWERVFAKNSTWGERANSYIITNAMKAKVKLGMGSKIAKKKKTGTKPKNKKCLNSFKDAVQSAKTAVKIIKPTNEKDAIKVALQAARKTAKLKNPNKITLPRVLPIPKLGGVIPFLVPLFAGLSAVGALAGGASGIAKAVNDANNAKKDLQESQRHNKTMEAIAIRNKNGGGLFLKQYKKGLGLYLKHQTQSKNF